MTEREEGSLIRYTDETYLKGFEQLIELASTPQGWYLIEKNEIMHLK